MKPKHIYYEKVANTVIANLEKRNMEGHYCPTSEEAVKKALSFLHSGMEVSFGGSMTLFETGMMDALKSRKDLILLDRSTAGSPEEVQNIYHRALSSDCYFMSTNAITLDGELINIDGTGNRLAALIYGPANVVIIAGMNKLSTDREQGYDRVRHFASPPNAIRIGRKTPCAETGKCHECFSDDCICSQIVITRRSAIKNRIKVILVGEELGY